jgi:imidazoleglycerol-phosphate dehydratase
MERPFMRSATIERDTTETQIWVSVSLDGDGAYDMETGVGFFDHMLEQLARHSLFDITIRANGDCHIDDHHTVEDVGVALGRAIAKAVDDAVGIRRYASSSVPMDETLSRVALDFSKRPFLIWRVTFPTEKIGDFDTQLVREFFTALAMNAGLTLHVETFYGENAHHIAESCFKALARALREAVEIDPRKPDAPPSTKGVLG